MGLQQEADVDKWLGDGGLVVAASERAARAVTTAFHRRRRAEGLTAWPAPAIRDWQSFALAAWQKCALNDRMLLNSVQEQALWAEIISSEANLVTLLDGPRRRLAQMAMKAHELLCDYAPQFLEPGNRRTWIQDAAAFSNWLSRFDHACQTHNVVSPARALLELTTQLHVTGPAPQPLLAVGFDRILPAQRALFAAWGPWQELPAGDPASEIHFYAARDNRTELDACALWCAQQLAADPQSRLLVISQEISTRRGEIERAFLRHSIAGAAPHFEFSLGVPLSQNEVARAALLLLQWLEGALAENEVDWLFSTSLASSSAEERSGLQAFMRALRRRGLQRTQWTLDAFLRQRIKSDGLPAAWIDRITHARRRLRAAKVQQQSPLDWSALVPQLLQELGVPGDRAFSSAEFQAYRRWEQAVDTCAALGFDGRRISWHEFLQTLRRAIDEMLFAPESSDVPIQIAGPAESAGLSADAIWFLGTDEDAWPSTGSAHPLLPRHVQRQASMPHATPHHDWEMAQSITVRLLSSASAVHFSYAVQKDDAEARPSRLIKQHAGHPQPLPKDLFSPSHQPPLTTLFEDACLIPFPPNIAHGGSSLLTAQSQCPFKAFASTRLGAQSWEPAEAGLTALQRGELLHNVLHRVWGGPPDGIRTQSELRSIPDLQIFVSRIVQNVLRDQMPSSARECMPQRYMELESLRLIQLVTEWLHYELARTDFSVSETEVKHPVTPGGLTLNLRLDRIDQLTDGTSLVIDYKTGEVTPKAWDLPRPDDVQLPLYAAFALQDKVGGLVFAKVRTRDLGFRGYVRQAKETLDGRLSGRDSLVKNPLTDEQMSGWKQYIEQLAYDFLAGHAEVNPREYPATCDRCGFQTICRIQDEVNRSRVEAPNDGEAAQEEAIDE